MGLTYRFVWREFPVLITHMARKCTLWCEESIVNLMVGWALLIYWRVCRRFWLSCSRIMNMPSMNLTHKDAWYGNVYTCFLSKLARKRFAKMGATLVPMAVPPTWRKWSLLTSKLFIFKTVLSKVVMVLLCRSPSAVIGRKEKLVKNITTPLKCLACAKPIHWIKSNKIASVFGQGHGKIVQHAHTCNSSFMI